MTKGEGNKKKTPGKSKPEGGQNQRGQKTTKINEEGGKGTKK